MIVVNSLAKAIRVVEFLPNEIERDLLILAWDISPDRIEPIVLGAMPADRWCFHENSGGDGGDYDYTSVGRWVLPDGTRFSNVTEVRVHFQTTFGQVQKQELDAMPRRTLPGARPLSSGSIYDKAIPATCGAEKKP